MKALKFIIVPVLFLTLMHCNTKQYISKNIAGSWKLASETDTLGLNVNITGMNLVYTFDNCSGNAGSCSGSFQLWYGTGAAPKPTGFSWTLDGSYLTITLGGVDTKFNVMLADKKNLTIQYLNAPKAHYNFQKK